MTDDQGAPSATSSDGLASWPSRWLLVLRIGASLTLFARGWLTWRWDSPIRGLFWQEGWWKPLLENQFGIEWSTWAEQSDPWISSTLDILGIALMAIAFLPWLPWKKLHFLLFVAAGILVIDSIARWVGTDFDFGMAIEHALQMATPVALFFVLRNPLISSRWLWTMAIMAAMTFVGHGLYASGFHPVPLSYQTMTMKILGIEDKDTVLLLLRIAGWLDFVVALGLFITPLRTASLLYMIVWGALTALARAWSHIGLDQPLYGLDPWIAETLVRTPHWLFPLLLLVGWELAGNRTKTAA